MSDENIIQIYGQGWWHEPAYIIGTRMGLNILLGAIRQALREGQFSINTFDSQGEGYSIVVRTCSEDELKSMVSQYSDDVAGHQRGEVLPVDLCKEARDD